MKTGLQRVLGLSSLMTLLLCAGCGGSSGPEVVSASGKVSYKGQPVPNATVSFLPATEGPMPIGVTDDSGNFSLLTAGQKGAPPGSYKVTVVAYEKQANAATVPEDSQMMTAADYQTKPAKLIIPAKYTAKISSPLSFEVKKGESNEFDLVLAD